MIICILLIVRSLTVSNAALTLMARKKLIISGRLGEYSQASAENAGRVVHWISQRIQKWEKTGQELSLKLPTSDFVTAHAEGRLAFEMKVWKKIRDDWNKLWRDYDKCDRETFRENYQRVVRDIRSWIERKLTDEERVRMLSALRQLRYQKRNSKSLKTKNITIRVDRDTYEAAMAGLPGGSKTQIIIRLLQQFTNDSTFRSDILQKVS